MWQTTVTLVVALLQINSGPLKTTRPSEAWLLRGSVVRVSDDLIEVRHKSGRVIPVVLDSTTTLEHKGAAVPVQMLGVKQRVSITVNTIGRAWRAQRVVIHSSLPRSTAKSET